MPLTPFPRPRTERELSALGTPFFYLLTHLLNCLGFRIWDLSLERDAEEEAEFRAKMKEQANAPEDLPPQLLFVHQVVQLNYPLILL